MNFKKLGFTLAEVLITLVIIGIVAVLTIPNIMQKYKKIEVETKLKRFYVMANQAITLSEIENGPKEVWDFNTEACNVDAYSEECLAPFWEKYLKKYFKYTKAEYIAPTDVSKGHMLIHLIDGSLLFLAYMGHDYMYYINKKGHSDYVSTGASSIGKNSFMFAFYPLHCSTDMTSRSKFLCHQGIVPYVHACYDGTVSSLYLEKVNYTKLIELNGWKIPDDYPIKF